jgi:hypothetical protein
MEKGRKRELKRGKDRDKRKEGKWGLTARWAFFLYSTLFNITPSTDPQIPLCTDGCWGRIEPWTVSKVALAVGDD